MRCQPPTHAITAGSGAKSLSEQLAAATLFGYDSGGFGKGS